MGCVGVLITLLSCAYVVSATVNASTCIPACTWPRDRCIAGTCVLPDNNDICTSALFLSAGQTIYSRTSIRNSDPLYPLCSPPGQFSNVTNSPGVWFRIYGDGRTWTVTTCSRNTTMNTFLSLYSGDCSQNATTFPCVQFSQGQTCASTINTTSTVQWLTTAGTDYLILVRNADNVTLAGDEFAITASATGPYVCFPACATNQVCLGASGTCCTPNCRFQNCGDDGCGGSCGSCQNGLPCLPNGQCCVPDCDVYNRTCGVNNCGTSCGTCSPTTSFCNSASQCQLKSCIPNCGGRNCGPDGCSGTCGSCSASQVCLVSGVCCSPNCTAGGCGPDGCGGLCGSGKCASGQACGRNGVCCTGSCVGKICGFDGCIGYCGNLTNGACPGRNGVCSADGTTCSCNPICGQCGSDGCSSDPAICGTCPSGQDCTDDDFGTQSCFDFSNIVGFYQNCTKTSSIEDCLGELETQDYAVIIAVSSNTTAGNNLQSNIASALGISKDSVQIVFNDGTEVDIVILSTPGHPAEDSASTLIALINSGQLKGLESFKAFPGTIGDLPLDQTPSAPAVPLAPLIPEVHIKGYKPKEVASAASLSSSLAVIAFFAIVAFFL